MSSSFFHCMKVVLDDVEVEINKVKTGETFAPEHNVNMKGNQLTDVAIDEAKESTVVDIKNV